MNYQNLEFSIESAVATVALNRPEVYNALDIDTSRELMDVSIRCDESSEIRAVVLTGNGKAFSAGGDLGAFARAGDDAPSLMLEMVTYLHAALSRFARMDAPLITAVNGVAAGAGMSIASAGDLSIASESARFTMAYTKAGLTPDGSSTYFLTRLIGLRRTQELMLTNRVLSAEEAFDWQVVNRVVPSEALVTEARALALQLAEGPTRAFGGVKRLLLMSTGDDLEAQMEREAREIVSAIKTRDGAEGVEAFTTKRRPQFVGY